MSVRQAVERWVGGKRARWAMGKLAPRLRPRERVLNLGSGDGLLSQMLRDQLGATVVDVDVTDMSLVREHPPVIYDGVHLPFEAGSFDAVLLLHVLHHCKDQEQVAREAARVCQGRVIVIEDTNRSPRDLKWLRLIHYYLDKMEAMPLADCRFLSPEGWAELFRGCGLAVVEQISWPRYMEFLPPGNHLFVLRPACS